MESISQKKCFRCSESFPATLEYFRKKREGLEAWCKQCCRKRPSYYHARKNKGQCSKCTRPIVPGRSRCAVCLGNEAAAARKRSPQRIRDRKASGGCIGCSGLAVEGHVYCENCREENNRRQTVRRQKQKDNGICTKCQSPAVQGQTKCINCLSKTVVYRKAQAVQRLAQGLCAECGRLPHLDGRNYCSQCQAYANSHYGFKRGAVLDAYGRMCACCGETTIQFLTIDHVNNDGAEERRKHGPDTARRVIELGFPDTFQILCFNCNCAKGIHGSCPHTWPTS